MPTPQVELANLAHMGAFNDSMHVIFC